MLLSVVEISPMAELSTKPYLIRAIYEWCADCGFTPYIGVNVDQNTRVPLEYVKKGQIVLSIGMQATRDLTIGKDLIQFSARFSGVSREIAVPIYAVASIFARENGQGMHFEREFAPLATVPSAPGAIVSIGLEGAPMLVPQPHAQLVVQPQLQSVPTGLIAGAHAEAGSSQSAGDQSMHGDEEKSAGDKLQGDKLQGDKPHDNKPHDNKPQSDKPKGPPSGKLRIIK